MKLSKKASQKILNMPTVGALCLSNWGGIAIKEVSEEEVSGVWYDRFAFKVPVIMDGRPCFYYGGTKYYLEEFMRV